MSAGDGPERLDTGTDYDLPEPAFRGDMLLRDHLLDETHDWVEIRLMMPLNTYRGDEKAAEDNLVSASDLVEDLVGQAGAPKKNGGYHTGVMLDFPRIPDGVASNPEEYR